jgi:hypothetical protein
MSTQVIVDRDVLTDKLLEVRRAVDEALRVLGVCGTPPLSYPSARPADVVLGSAAPSQHQHSWVPAGFGGTHKECAVCGMKE